MAPHSRWWEVRCVKWLSEHWTDNRYVVALFLALAVVNALAMQTGYGR